MSGRDSSRSSSVYSQDSDRERRERRERQERRETRPQDSSSGGPPASPRHASYMSLYAHDSYPGTPTSNRSSSNSIARAGPATYAHQSRASGSSSLAPSALTRNTDSMGTYIDSRPQSSVARGPPSSSFRSSSGTLPFVLDTNSPQPASARPPSSSARTSSGTLPFMLDTRTQSTTFARAPSPGPPPSARSSQQSVGGGRDYDRFVGNMAGVDQNDRDIVTMAGMSSREKRRRLAMLEAQKKR